MSKRARDDSPDAAAHQNKKRKLHSYSVDFKINAITFHKQGMSQGDMELTRAGNMKPPSRVRVATWIKTAWARVSVDIIKKSFVVCGVSNAMDNSEDEQINVLKPGGVLYGERDHVLASLRDPANTRQDIVEDMHEKADNELDVIDDSDDEDDIPLAHIL